MSFFKNLFGKKEQPIKTYTEFWNWFQENEKTFFEAVKQRKNIEKNFFDKLSPKLAELKEGFFFVTGMYAEDIAELVFTADGVVKNFVFVEEIVKAAPAINGWKFTSLKPSLDIKDVSIKMGGHNFNENNIYFYQNELAGYPDEIDISIIHDDYNEKDKNQVINGTYIFLDNYLGELNFATSIDNIRFIAKKDAEKELIPVSKLKDFLNWRQKEFIEKYEGTRHDTENDSYSNLEAQLKDGQPLIAVVNSSLLEWDNKASHPWLLTVEIKYDGKNNNGMPDKSTYKMLESIEDEIMLELKDFNGYLNIARQTAGSSREIYFACKEFRKPSLLLHNVQKKYSNLNIEYEIHKDKYWRALDWFNGAA
ncbi:MAG: DUF695 domain-containing protein [Ferruginibacter sp.]